MNIFAPLDATVNPEPSFWQSVPGSFIPSKAQVKYFGVLQVAEESHDVVVSEFALVDCKLFKYGGSWVAPRNITVVDLRWKILEPFFEEDENGPLYGFSLTGRDFVVEFYAQDSESLEGWLRYLSCNCIMTGFDDEFQIADMIGEGSTCKVYKAIADSDNLTYAVKRISKSLLIDSPSVYKAMANEIEVLRTLKHPNVIKMYRIYDTETDVCMIEECLLNGSLIKKLKIHTVLAEEEACVLIWALLDTLEHLQDNNIVHRDLKLENILTEDDDNPTGFRIADFGSSTYDTGDALHQKTGSPGFIAPEILDGIPYGKKVDVFSTGIILYCLLVGDLPFYDPDVRTTLDLNQRCDINYAVPALSKISAECLEFLKAITTRNPQNRPTACQAKNFAWFTHNSSIQNLIEERLASSSRKGSRKNSESGLYQRRPMTFHEESKHVDLRDSIVTSPRIRYLTKLRTAH